MKDRRDYKYKYNNIVWIACEMFSEDQNYIPNFCNTLYNVL